MVKRLLLILLALLLLGIIVVSTAGIWLLLTPQGARWLLETTAGAAGARLEIDEVEGRLVDDLRLFGARLDREGTEATLDRLHLRWNPGRLLQGEFSIMELALEGGDLSVNPVTPPEEEEGPFEFTWPRLSGLPLRLDAVVERLHLENITVYSSEGEVKRLDSLTVRLAWDDGTLTVSDLDAAAEGYRLEGNAAAGFVSPLLQLDLRLALPESVVEMEGLRLTADLEESDAALLTGPVELQGGSDTQTVLELKSRIVLIGEALRLRGIELTHSSWKGVLSGEGEVALADPYAFTLQAEVKGLDLGKETGVAAELGGRVELSGTLQDYGGRFELTSRGVGWRQGRLAGLFSGSMEGIALSDLDGSWLRGSIEGEATAGWREGVQVEAMLRGRGLDPEVFDPQWSGRVNLDMEGSLTKIPEEALRADVKGKLLDSTLRGRPLTGMADLSLKGEDLNIAALELHGDGFDLAAHGRLRERLDIGADVRRLNGLIPGAAGSLQAEGWLRWSEGQLAGSLGFQGGGIAFAGVRTATLRGEVNRPEGRPFSIRLHSGGLAYDRLRLDSLELSLAGSLERHDLDLKAGGPQGRGMLLAEGGWTGEFWAVTVEKLQGETSKFGDWRLVAPVALQFGAGRVKVAPMRLEGGGGMVLEMTADLKGSPLRGTLHGAWREIDLSLMGPWLPETMKMEGRSSGETDLRLLEGERTAIVGRVEAAGRLTMEDFSVSFSQVAGTIDWDDGGLAARFEAEPEGGGRLAAELNSEEAPMAMPQRGTLEASWEGIDLSLLRPWVPSAVRVRGALSGQIRGQWLPGQKLVLTGSAGVGDGEVTWRGEDGEVAFALRTAEARWLWEGKSLQGDLDLSLAEVGRIEGSFSLPLQARIPTSLLPQGPLSVRLRGEMREQGLLSAIFPGLLRESEGELTAQLIIGGTWRSPEMNGGLHLSGAGAYLPAAGIEIEEVEVKAELSGQRLRLVTFSARSGPGRIQGEGELRLDQWRVAEYQATVKGERFQAVHLPELQLLVSPDLELSGTTEKLRVRGTVELPELILVERKRPEMVAESPDVVIVGGETPAERGNLPIALDLRVKVVLGKRVLIKHTGVDARLAGELTLIAEGIEDINAQGEIHVAEGIYSAYGVQLKIDRGRILFAGGPVDRPTLDILALRTIGEVKAGVKVVGTPREPVVKLYSDPAMPDTDVLSYIVLGYPMGGDRESAALLMGAAGALLSGGESVVLQDRLKRQLGVDVLTIESGGGEVESSMVTIGKYLSPRLYISYGQSLFTESSVARLRYEISDHWEVESKMGEESGVDLYYKIEFK